METHKLEFLFKKGRNLIFVLKNVLKKHAYLSVSAGMFCKQFLPLYCAH